MGRRGSGKSTHLFVLRRQLQEKGTFAAYIDMERFSRRDYPDVLIEVLIALIKASQRTLRRQHVVDDLKTWRLAHRIRKQLQVLLRDAQFVRRQLIRGKSTGTSSELNAGGSASIGGVGLTSSIGRASRKRSDSLEFSEVEVSKIQRLRELVPQVSELLTRLSVRSEGGYALAFFDDFGYVALCDQPAVLGYLNQVCKGTGFWLKIGVLGSRLQTIGPGDPPEGVTVGQDIDALSLDVTLDEFATAKLFLESLFEGIAGELGVTASELFAVEARERLVLACGGAVARDYLTIVGQAIAEALERAKKKGKSARGEPIRITASDVQKVVSDRIADKEAETLRLDGGHDRQQLSERWRDVCSFVDETLDNPAFVLVEQARLEGDSWGREVQQLEALRLLHRIRTTTPNSPNWRGRRVVVFMLDLGQVARERMRSRKIPRFWENENEFDKLRRAEWVYSHDWRDSQVNRRNRARARIKGQGELSLDNSS